MVDSYLDSYLGDWEDERGNRLNIRKVDDETALVSFFAVIDGKPIYRPWHQNEITVDMVGKYYPGAGPEIIVELWRDEEFTLHLTFEASYILDRKQRDALIPALSRLEEHHFLDQYYHLFGELKHYTKRR